MMTARSPKDCQMANENNGATRRDFLKRSTGLAVGASLVGTLAVPRAVHAGSSEKIRIGLIGCGQRGTAAAQNALDANPENVLVAVGDAIGEFANSSVNKLRRIEQVKDRVQVPADH